MKRLLAGGIAALALMCGVALTVDALAPGQVVSPQCETGEAIALGPLVRYTPYALTVGQADQQVGLKAQWDTLDDGTVVERVHVTYCNVMPQASPVALGTPVPGV